MPTIEPRTLETFVARIVKELGADTSDAAAVAESLVSADLCGHHSHGVRLLPSKYQPEIREGKIDPTAEPVLERDSPLTAIVDGQKAFGQVVGRFAIDEAVAKARETGICVAGVRNVSHLGRIGEWTCRAAGSDLVCLAFVANPSSRHVAPAGTAEPRLSTNPISIGIPTFDAFDFPVLLDMATSQIAKGKTRLYDAEDEQLPEECVVTSDGESVIDPSRYLDGQGALLPLGGLTSGHKGFGLATVAELLAANVSDGDVSGESDALWGNEAAFFLIDLTQFTTRERVAERITAFDEYLESTPSAEFNPGAAVPGDRPLLPGEAEYRQQRRQRREGISLSRQDAAAIAELAANQGLADAVPPALSNNL